MNLLVLRHGESAVNIEQRYLGGLDPGLTERGIQQARLLAEQLPGDIEHILCSPLLRARQTAEIIARPRGLQPTVATLFRERHVGVFEGLTQAEAQARHPDLWARNITRQWRDAPTGGETIEAVAMRVRDGLIELQERYGDTPIALVAHGFVAKLIRAISQQRFADLFTWQLANAESVLVTCNAADLQQPLHPLWQRDQGAQ